MKKEMIKELVKLADTFDKRGLLKEADILDGLVKKLTAEKEKSKRQKIHEKYYNEEAGHYKGGKGTRFENCEKEKLALDNAGEIDLRVNKKHPTKEDAADALCGWINAHK